MRPLPAHRPPFGPDRLGRLRLRASHSRYFWALRLHLVCTPSGLPISYALAHPKLDERDIARDLLDTDPDLLRTRTGQTLVADKGI